jgi:transcriptional regulator with XRE-family HTH domain
MSYFGIRLKYLRRQDGLTQVQLADALGVKKSTIGMWENGKRDPDFETLEKLADYFNVNIGSFFVSEENGPAPGQGGEPAVNMDSLSATKRELIDRVMRMDDAATRALLEAIDRLRGEK